MTTEKKTVFKATLKKVGKAVWSAIPWVCLWIALSCWLMLPLLRAEEKAELTNQIAAFEAEKAMYESQYERLADEIEWLRSLIKEAGNEQVQP